MATNQKEGSVFTEDDILRALTDGPKRPGKIKEFLGLPDRQELAGQPPIDWPWAVNLVSDKLQKMKAAGKVVLFKGQWRVSDSETLTVQVPKDHGAGLREFLAKIGGRVL